MRLLVNPPTRNSNPNSLKTPPITYTAANTHTHTAKTLHPYRRTNTTHTNSLTRVVTSNTVLHKGAAASLRLRGTRISECLVDDDTASILFTARNEQVDVMKPGTTVILRKAKIAMFKGTMRLAVDKWGLIEVTEPAKFVVKEDNNLSLVEYELVNVVD